MGNQDLWSSQISRRSKATKGYLLKEKDIYKHLLLFAFMYVCIYLPKEKRYILKGMYFQTEWKRSAKESNWTAMCKSMKLEQSLIPYRASLVVQTVNNPPAMQVQFLVIRKSPWSREWLPTPGILAWRIPPTQDPGGLQSMESLRVRHD